MDYHLVRFTTNDGDEEYLVEAEDLKSAMVKAENYVKSQPDYCSDCYGSTIAARTLSSLVQIIK